MRVKKLLYFTIASYFRFWAQLKLASWKPTIITVTGSSGKTTLLHLIESQLGTSARYSHHANSAFGIPFDILGLHRKTLTRNEWPMLFAKAPLALLDDNPSQKIYIVEADSDRPGEAQFISSLLNPDVTLWMNSGRTHTMNFDRLVKDGSFASAEDAVAYEFGYFLERTKQLALVNGDSSLMVKQLKRARAEVQKISLKNLESYKVHKETTDFTYEKQTIRFPFLVPRETFYALSMTVRLLEFLHKNLDLSFSSFELPPGRSSVFGGKKDITIIDSSYNATPDGVVAILHMFSLYPGKKKWAVMGDMLELGDEEEVEHQHLASLLSSQDLDQVILVGPRTQKNTYPLLKKAGVNVVSFENPADALAYIKENIRGNEIVLFKGARFLEGIIEHLLKDKKDISKLCRREQVWQKRRQQWGL